MSPDPRKEGVQMGQHPSEVNRLTIFRGIQNIRKYDETIVAILLSVREERHKYREEESWKISCGAGLQREV